MLQQLKTMAEINAEKAENLKAFSGIKLLYIRNNVKELLSLIGRSDMFDQYTKHDISHIDEMLNMLEWLIPKETIRKMTCADWLMLVLSIYFHDLGMIVTKQEYMNRNNITGFIVYKNEIENENYGLEYKEKIKALGDESEKFLYQEFVRLNHATRIKNWICGNFPSDIGECSIIVQEISKMLDNLDSMFRRDLARICESHHMNDLDDFGKYKTCIRYGTDDNEAVNMHYISIILRTVDLLHITSDRTPSIQYRIINPSDPKSIIEWKKQMAVKAIRAKPKLNEDGNIDISLPQDTIQVTAYFDKPDQAEAFFGLIAYLMYAKKEIKQSYNLIQKAIKTQGAYDYNFPWNDIDDNNIETLGFERKLLQFNLDQNNILRLLVGHTLYNDSSVVLRELTQNALDAVKLQNLIEVEEHKKTTTGKICIKWSNAERKLSITDNGTGMSINDIENYLLRVGLSKYRTDDFIKKYPNFPAISRFGIGILTCFLIANDIDIITNTSEEETANMISLRKIDGKYLLKKLDKHALPIDIKKHGTEIVLSLRPDVDMSELEYNIKKWVVFPSSEVFLQIDTFSPIKIGHVTPREALEEFMHRYGYQTNNKQIKIVQDELDGVTIAYALRYSEFLKEWDFVTHGRFTNIKELSPIGTCIEGIRVEFNTPGYNTNNILAIVNITSNGMAKTNVARSAIEANEEKTALLLKIYKLYSKHIQNQIDHLIKDGYSMAWATAESKYLIEPLLPKNIDNALGFDEFDNREKVEPQDSEILFLALNDIKSMIIEKESRREAVSPNDIMKTNEVYIIDSKMIRAAESLLREIYTNTTLCDLINTISEDENNKLVDMDNVICNFDKYNILHRNALFGKQVTCIDVFKKQRRIDLLYGNNVSIWHNFELNLKYANNIHIPFTDFKINGISNEVGVKTVDGIYLSYDHELTKYIINKIAVFNYINNREDFHLLRIFLSCIFNSAALNFVSNDSRDNLEEIFERHIEMEVGLRYNEEIGNNLWNKVDKNQLLSILFKDKYYIYDPSEWSRNQDK